MENDDVIKAVQKVGQEFLSNNEYHKQLHQVTEMVKEMLKQEGEYTMMFHLYGRTYASDNKDYDLTMVMMADWPPPETLNGKPFGKRGAMEAIGAKFVKDNPDMMLVNIIVASEAWMAKRAKDAPEEDMNLAPSEDPNRVEGVIISANSIDQRHSMCTYELKRDEDGEFDSLKPLETILFDSEDKESQDKIQDNLTVPIYQGYFMAKTGEDDNAKTG